MQEETIMPMLQFMLGRLNRRFSGQELLETTARREMWAPGRSLGQIARENRTAPPELLLAWTAFLDTMPAAIQETIRAVAYAALSADPPVEVTFAWAPSYDFEVTVWQAPDTRTTKGGITLLIRSRYPDDRHPIR
jgi:hypothetical protein